MQEPRALRRSRFQRSCARLRHLSGRVVLASMLLCPAAARSQMQLPGAVSGAAPAPAQKGASTSGGSAPSSYAPPKPVIVKAPAEDTVTGQTLSLDGSRGEMALEKSGDGLALSKLKLVGSKISKPGASCTVDVPLASPLAIQPAGRPAGAIRYSVPVAGCSFSVDILTGAVLLTRAEPSCDFGADDCKVSPQGLWGPRADDITPKRAKDLERERVRLETIVRANFHALLRKAGKDRDAVKMIAKDQAAFSSEREMLCRDYSHETVHGFCSTQITEERALALAAQFGTMPEGPHGRRARPRATGAARKDETE